MAKISPLAPDSFPDMPTVPGVRMAACACGLRYKNRCDLMLVELAHDTSVAGVFTLSTTAAAPVEWCRKALSGGVASALIVNSGNANVFTGKAGYGVVENTVEAVADIFPCRPSTVFVASTGVIGEPLDSGKIIGSLGALKDQLSDDGWKDAAAAIMTTDTYPKGATRTATIDGAEVVICGIAKGSGMIAPNMATMLSFIFTDADIPADILQQLLADAVAPSFNCITIDSDTSTSDTVLLFATGQGAEHEKPGTAVDPLLDDFRDKLNDLAIDLAHQIVRDGEGASKFVTVDISGAEDNGAARRIALSIANSPLVKTAIAAADANWGRIVMAIGKAGEKADRDRISITIGGHLIAEDGGVVDGYDETIVAEYMKGDDIVIAVDVGVGDGKARVWTCDLTHGYIDINANYRT